RDAAEVWVAHLPHWVAFAVDLLGAGSLFPTINPPAGATEDVFSGLPAGINALESWLPQNIGMTVTGLRIGSGAAGDPLPDHRPRWITYGSSITQCVAASSPSRAWPAIAAAACGWKVPKLGFAGSGHMAPMIGRLIRDLPADFISRCVGVNIYGAGTLSPRMFKPLLIGLLETIRDRHKETPLLVISPIYGTVRETEPNPLGFTLPMMREDIRQTVELLRERGDRQLYDLDGLSWFGPEDEAFLTDGLHPGAEGYELLGRRFCALHQAALQAGQTQQSKGEI
ncbi:GDSL family lipase, partial [Paenibacillus riograndensis]